MGVVRVASVPQGLSRCGQGNERVAGSQGVQRARDGTRPRHADVITKQLLTCQGEHSRLMSEHLPWLTVSFLVSHILLKAA